MIKSYWHVTVYLAVILVVGVALGLSIKYNAQACYEKSNAEPPCQDFAVLKSWESEFKCHPQAVLQVHWGGAVPSGSALYTCHCKR